MVSGALDSTKSERARLPGNTLVRARLDEVLARAEAPLTLVVAGPGYGKTVAVSQWASRASATVAWVSLDAADDGPRPFWTAVATSLDHATDGHGREALLMLADEQDTGLVVGALLDDLPDAPLVLVLDDLQVVRSPPTLAELQRFVERLPPSVRIVATSRVDPQLPLGRWRAAGLLAELRQRDLRFTNDEAAALVEASGLEGIDADDVALLATCTEGWAAGLALALVSMRQQDDPREYLQASLTADRGIGDYLLGEVLASLDDEDRALVLDLSVLDDFDAALAVAVTGRTDAGTRIRSLERRNLLLLPADQRGERFRFHQLLRELLVAELRWRTPGRDLALHAAAAEHLEATGDPQRAAVHLVAAGQLDAAFRLVVDPAWELLDRGQVVEARRRLDLLPDGAVGADPDRILAHLVLLTAAGRVGDADRRMARLEADDALVAFDGTQEVQFFGLRSMVEYIRGDLVPSQLSLLRCLELLGDGELRGPVLDRLGGMLLRHAIDEHDLDAADWWLAAMDDHLNESLVVRDLLPTALAARLAMERGRLDEAERLARHVAAAADADQLGAVAPAGEARVVLAEVLLAQGHLGEAEEQSTLATRGLAERRLTVLEVRARLAAVDVAAARYGPASGRTLLEATRVALEHRHLGVDVRQWLDLAACRLDLADGAHEDALARVGRLPRSNGQRLVLARAQLLCGAASSVGTTLDDLERPFVREQIEALLLRARAATGPASLELVRQAAVAAVRSGFFHTFLREGPEVLRLARRAHAEEPTPALGALLERSAPPRRPQPSGAFTEPLTEREAAVLELLPTHLTYGEIAGQLCVSINTVKTYQKAVFRKLNVSRRSEAVALARQVGLLDGAASR